MKSSYIGKVIDNYRIVQQLGIGGMGVVFKAVHIKLDKVVALKMIAPGLAMNERFIKRFETEAKALAKLEDPNIVRIFDLRHENDQWFIVMEFIEGVTLTERIKKEGALSWQEGIPILHQILTSIGHAHQAGIIHRDIKPNNIMLTPGGQIKITDFGLAKDQQSAAHTLTITAGGTLYYMSPEHVKGFAYTDHRSDIYSIGMTAYEMLTGKVPFEDAATDFDIREKIVRKVFTAIRKYKPDIPKELNDIVMKAIAKQPEKRYQRAEEMLAEVKKFQAAYLEAVTTGKKPLRRLGKKYLAYSMVVLVAIILIIGGIFLYNTFFQTEHHYDAGIVPATEESTQLSDIDTGEPQDTTVAFIDLAAETESNQPAEVGIPLNRQAAAMPESKRIERVNRIPGTAAVSIQSVPDGATIWLEGRIIGRTPFALSGMEVGHHEFILKKEGFQDQLCAVEVKSMEANAFTINLAPITTTMTIVSDPEDATVSLDGMEIAGQKTPLDIANVALGKHTLLVTKNGYRDYRSEIDVLSEEQKVIQMDLQQLLGTLVVLVKPWGSIYIDGNLKKENTKIKYQVDLPVKNYEISVVHPTLGRYVKNINLAADQMYNLTVDFNRTFAVKIITYAENKQAVAAKVIADNSAVEMQTPVVLNLNTGIHKLQFKNDRYNSSKEILVDESTPKILEFILD